MSVGVQVPVETEQASADNTNGNGHTRPTGRAILNRGRQNLVGLAGRCYQAMSRKFGRDASRDQVTQFAELVRPLGVEVYVREGADHWIVFAALANRELRDRVLEAQGRVGDKLGMLAFELILVYPEDAQRPGLKQLLQAATRA